MRQRNSRSGIDFESAVKCLRQHLLDLEAYISGTVQISALIDSDEALNSVGSLQRKMHPLQEIRVRLIARVMVLFCPKVKSELNAEGNEGRDNITVDSAILNQDNPSHHFEKTNETIAENDKSQMMTVDESESPSETIDASTLETSEEEDVELYSSDKSESSLSIVPASTVDDMDS
ncbi:hypothetical protein QAD02_012575 [Eretmocerus hayati]|uniref:Uncharacterized protein n=1 Tax=Eretmocerus hayati TaxID=131215 RepID=A0ACC2P113_9HYME|nr:hypothetical protein QAD02_012575 [Eretmocerus hayati]